jgi:hypothetical protein
MKHKECVVTSDVEHVIGKRVNSYDTTLLNARCMCSLVMLLAIKLHALCTIGLQPTATTTTILLLYNQSSQPCCCELLFAIKQGVYLQDPLVHHDDCVFCVCVHRATHHSLSECKVTKDLASLQGYYWFEFQSLEWCTQWIKVIAYTIKIIIESIDTQRYRYFQQHGQLFVWWFIPSILPLDRS